MTVQTKLGLLLVALTVGVAVAAPRESPLVTKMTRNDGNTRVGFRLQISSVAWTAVLSSDPTRRYAVIHGTGTAMLEVCLSTVSAAATKCQTNTDGRHMPTVGIVIEDYNEGALYARSIESIATVANSSTTLLGEYQYDSGDSLDADN